MSKIGKAFPSATATKAAGCSISRTLAAIFFSVILVLTTYPYRKAIAQGITTGVVMGTIVDPSGAKVPKASVMAIDPSNGTKLITESGEDGTFSIGAIPIGIYHVTIAAVGFSRTSVENLEVRPGTTINLSGIRLTIGNSELVQVNGSAASMLETNDSQVTTTFSSQSIQALPLNNGFDTIAELIPGVVSTHGDDFSNANGDNFSVNGQSGRYNNFELDGQSNNDSSVGGPQIFFGSQDAISELQVVTNDYSSQYGRNAGAVVNYLTKSGTDAFHGSGFDLYQGSFASSLANQQKNPVFGYCVPTQDSSEGCTKPHLPRFVENRFGGTIGGPISNDKLFFFFSGFWDRVREGAAPSQSLPNLTPDRTGITQLRAAFPNNPSVEALAADGPYGVTAGDPEPILGSQLTETITGPGEKTAQIEFSGVQRLIPSVFNDQEELGRLDWQASPHDHSFIRYFYQSQISTGLEGISIAAGDFADVLDAAHSIGADWSHIFSDHLVDQFRYSFQQTKNAFQGGAHPNCTVNNITACTAQVTFNGGNQDLGFGTDTTFPQGRTVKVTQIQDNVMWNYANNTVLFGGEWDYQNSANSGLFNYNGSYNFATLSNYLQNGPGGDSAYMILANGSPLVVFKEPDAAAYLQDDWRMGSTFTANIGLRWEYFGQALNGLHESTVARESDPNTALWAPNLPLAARTFAKIGQNYKGFEPRLGFAWNPTFDKGLVVRGGYSINANPAYYNLFILAADAAPVVNTNVVDCSLTTCIPSNGSIEGSSVRAVNLPALPTDSDPRSGFEQTFPSNFRTPYVQTYSVGIEHRIGDSIVGGIRYVGSKTTKDFQSVNGNPYLLNVQQAFPAFLPLPLCTDPTQNGYGRPSCNYNNLAPITNGGWAGYSGLQLNLTARSYHGLTLTSSYTWSKSLDNTTDGFQSTGGAGNTTAIAQNPLDTSASERGLSGNDFPNVLGIGYVYQVPSLLKTRGLSLVTNGFVLSGIYRFNSGQVYTPYQGLTIDDNNGDSSFCDGSFNMNFTGSDTCRLVMSNKKAPRNTVAYLNPYTGPQDPHTGSPTLGIPEYVAFRSDSYDQTNGMYYPGTPVDPTSTRWIINNQAYAVAVGNPYPGSSRSLLRGQSFSDFDATVIKTTRITERVSLQLSLAAYNALNQMYLGTGNAVVNSSTFASNDFNSSGSASGISSGNRFIIIGSKLAF